ncbi:aspartyl/asparaginyl beta-hydroxylase domain-containing protein [bacterium]|nr:aspartyl/asparaginyl beta-hydroxylase domain-containing protein [bacterium]
MDVLLSPQALALAVLVAATVAVHLRGRERMSLKRQVSDYSTFTAPYNVFLYLASAVPNRPYLDLAAFPELELLRRNWEAIRDEARALHEAGHIRATEGHDDVYGNSLFKKGWRRFYLKWYGDPLASARRLCPTSVALLEQLPRVHAAMFSLVGPRSRLGKHRDPLAASLRYHLGLITPNSDACRILVDGVPYAWRDGEGVLFDETYLHWVENDTDESRIVLFCDVERPLRWRLATAVNRWVIRRVAPSTAARNEAGEPLGAVNRLAAAYYPLQQAGRRLKARNRRLYYGLKFSLMIAVVAAILVLL